MTENFAYIKTISKSGVSYIELLIVVALMAIIGMMSAPFLSNFFLNANFFTSTDQTVSMIRKAQNYSITKKNNEIWGICISGSDLIVYSSSCETPTTSQEYSIPNNIDIGGFTDVSFSLLRGEPSSAATITISSNTGESSKTINLNSAGGMTFSE